MNANLQCLEANLAERVAEIFRGCPELSGFTVAAEMPVPGHMVYGSPVDLTYAELIVSAVTQTLAELVEEEPEASPLVLGRTFARVLH